MAQGRQGPGCRQHPPRLHQISRQEGLSMAEQVFLHLHAMLKAAEDLAPCKRNCIVKFNKPSDDPKGILTNVASMCTIQNHGMSLTCMPGTSR